MNYSDIIEDNRMHHTPVDWWASVAFHYTDITNAISILKTGYLYSRAEASSQHFMNNDNASRQVIDMTNYDVISKVRFYFRPLTPTQYYNEGYKHPNLRYDSDINANVPVPVFLVFDLESILSTPGAQFSEQSQSGGGSPAYSGVEAFSKLNFDAIYDNSYENFSSTKNYRHAEITIPNCVHIDPHLRRIVCRNQTERISLLNLLRETDRTAFDHYKGIIKVYNKDIFENNGLFIDQCVYFRNMLRISFTDTCERRKYINRMLHKNNIETLPPVGVTIELTWLSGTMVLDYRIVETKIDIENPGNITIKNLPNIPNAAQIGIKVYFEKSLMCYVLQPLESSELWG